MDKKLLLLAFVSALIVPRSFRLGLIHLSFIFFCGSITFQAARSKLKLGDVFLLVILTAWPLVGSIAATLNGIPQTWLSVRSFFPIFVFAATFVVVKNIQPSQQYILVNILLMAAVLSLFVVCQTLFQSDVIRAIWSPVERARNTVTEFDVLAPTGNPNNSAVLFGLSLLSVIWAYNKFDKSTMKVRTAVSSIISSKLVVSALVLILVTGIVFAYARTVVVSLMFAVVVLVAIRLYKKYDVVVSTLGMLLGITILLVAYIYIANTDGRLAEYYLTIFKLTEAASIQARLAAWQLSYELLVGQPILLLTGVGEYEAFFNHHLGNTILDSGIVYVIVSYGLLFLLVLLVTGTRLITDNLLLAPLFIFLLISSITLPFVSDYIMNIAVSYIVALIVTSEVRNIW